MICKIIYITSTGDLVPFGSDGFAITALRCNVLTSLERTEKLTQALREQDQVPQYESRELLSSESMSLTATQFTLLIREASDRRVFSTGEVAEMLGASSRGIREQARRFGMGERVTGKRGGPLYFSGRELAELRARRRTMEEQRRTVQIQFPDAAFQTLSDLARAWDVERPEAVVRLVEVAGSSACACGHAQADHHADRTVMEACGG